MLQSKINSIPVGIKIGIFDACQSGAVTAFKGGTRAEPFYLQNQQQIKGLVTIASSAANERAQESETLKGSIFTFHWINGLRGSADVSADKRHTCKLAMRIVGFRPVLLLMVKYSIRRTGLIFRGRRCCIDKPRGGIGRHYNRSQLQRQVLVLG